MLFRVLKGRSLNFTMELFFNFTHLFNFGCIGSSLPHSMCNLPGLGITPTSPALAGGFVTREILKILTFAIKPFFIKICKSSLFG